MPNRRSRFLITAAATLLALPMLAWPLPARAAADGCAPGMTADFNGDGRSDALVGDPDATVGGQANAGRVVVLYGDADGRVGEGARDVLWQGEGSVVGVAEAGDRFGFAIATADVDCDGYTDAVVGTPNEDVALQADSGYVQVIWGSPTGLGTGDGSDQYTQATFGRPIAAGDQFGTPWTSSRTWRRAAPAPHTPSPWPSGYLAPTTPAPTTRRRPARARPVGRSPGSA